MAYHRHDEFFDDPLISKRKAACGKVEQSSAQSVKGRDQRVQVFIKSFVEDNDNVNRSPEGNVVISCKFKDVYEEGKKHLKQGKLPFFEVARGKTYQKHFGIVIRGCNIRFPWIEADKLATFWQKSSVFPTSLQSSTRHFCRIYCWLKICHKRMFFSVNILFLKEVVLLYLI